MEQKISELRASIEAKGYAWTPALRARAIANGAIDDSVDVNPGFVMGPTGMQFNPLAANVVAGAIRGATAGFANPAMVGPSGDKALDLAGNVAGQVGELVGMAAAAAVLRTPAALWRLPGMLSRIAPAAVKGAQYGLASGVASGLRNDLPARELLKGAIIQSEKDALLFGGLAGIPSLPAKLGGAYGQSALIGAGMGAATGGPEGALAGALAFPLSHALTGPVFAGRTRAPEDPAVARAASERMALESLLREQYLEKQANEAFLELQSRKFEDLVPAKVEVQKRKTYEKTLANSPAEMASEAALELADRPEDARTQPNEGPKVPLFQGEKLYRTPVLAPEKAPASDITPEEASAIAKSLTIPGMGRPGQRVVIPGQGGQRPGSIKVVPGGKGETIIVLRRPGSRAASPRHPEPLNTQEELGRAIVDETARTYNGGDVPLNPPPKAPMLKPGFLKTAEEKVANRGDIVLGTGAGGLEQIKQAFRRPGQKKAAKDKRPGVKKDNLLAAGFLPTEVQIARQSPEARLVAEMLRAGKNEPKMAGGRFARALVEHRSSGLKEDESMSIGQAIQGFKDPETLTPKARKLMDITRRYLREVAIKSGAADMKLYTVGGKRVPFPGPNDRFFPHITVKTEELKEGGKARNRVIKNAVAIRAFGTEAEAGEMLDSYVDIAESGLHARNKKMAESLVARGKAESVEEAINLIQGQRRDSGPNRFGSLEYAREFDNPFYEPDFNKAMTQYSREAQRRIAETKHWGQDNEKLKIAIAQIRDSSERHGVELTAETAKGITNKLSKPIDDAAIVLRRFGSYMMSPLSAIRNTGQADNTLLLTDFKSIVKSINLNREARLRAIESGATSGTVLHDVEMGKGGAPSYQKIIGQTGTEVLLRTHANNAGMNYLHDNVDKIRKNPNDKFAAHELRKMGQDPVDLASGRELTRTDYNKAGFKIAERGQFMYDELDVPAWFNATQTGKTISQFRPWIIQQSHLIYDETVGQWNGGTIEGKLRCLRNVGLLATLYPMRGEVLNDFVALLQGKKRESNLFLRYLEDSAQMGVLTVLADAYNAVQYDNAEGLMMGASLSKTKDVLRISSSLVKNGKLSYSDQRLLFRMIPIIGPLFAYRVFPQKEKSAGTRRPGSGPSPKAPPKKMPPKKKVPKKQPIRQPDYLTKSS